MRKGGTAGTGVTAERDTHAHTTQGCASLPLPASPPPSPRKAQAVGPRRAPPRGGPALSARPRAPPPPAPRPAPPPPPPPAPGPHVGLRQAAPRDPRPPQNCPPRTGVPVPPCSAPLHPPGGGQVQRPVPRGSAAPSRPRTGLRPRLPGGQPSRCLTSCGPPRLPGRAGAPRLPAGPAPVSHHTGRHSNSGVVIDSSIRARQHPPLRKAARCCKATRCYGGLKPQPPSTPPLSLTYTPKYLQRALGN
ncbi:proline-rich protein HaeIII subfamily 1-like [Chiroxiphia lanceolata]|uniref:proline-rich protein HaeIII subfamily 1-like n=1 Tax=Chiroxiphia lanceolata TaxID=296741 RepID=UPI0013CEA512|nr:proline-rich protein HaeIII subfamily 1-like [Chiroxiphia lanceolata]